jgi:DNA invertase Pin-like site-specific DNA recombinase
MTKVAIYARVSTVDKQDYQRQVNDCTAVILSEGYSSDDIEIFAEKISGYKKNEDRPELDKMLNIIRTSPKYFDCIYVSEISRLGRDPNYTRQLIDELSTLKIPIYIQSIGQKTLLPDGERNSIMNIIIQVLMEFAHSEARTFSTRSKSGLLQSATSGKAGGGAYLPYGYTKNKITKELVVDKDEEKVIIDIFNYYQEGKGCKVIAGLLNGREIPTRANKIFTNRLMKVGDKNSDEIIWSDKTINDIINNPIYKGDRRYKGEKINENDTSYTGNVIKRKNEKYKELILFAPAIISSELFDECNELMKTKTHRNYLTTYTYLLKDLLVCGCCGRNYFAKFKPVERGDKVYICSSRLNKGGNCGNAGINISLLESAIYNEIVNSPDILNFIGNKDIKKHLESTIYSLQQQLLTNKKELSTIENRQNRLLLLWEKSKTMKVQEYDIRQSNLINEQKLLQDKNKLINKELSQNKTALLKQDDKKATQQLLIDAKENRSELATIFKQFIDKVVIKPINKNYTSIALYACVNGVKLPEPLYIILDLTGIRKKPIQYRYIPYFIPAYDGDEDVEDYYIRLNDTETIINNTPFISIADNLILIENTYPNK